MRLVNGSIGDPVLYVDYPGRDDALLFDAGDNALLPLQRLADLTAVFCTHHHVDHFIGLDRIVRANIDRDKRLQVFGPAGTLQKVYDRITSYEYPFFPFQKIEIEVHEVLQQTIRSGILRCSHRFPEPEVSEQPWVAPVVWEQGGLRVEAIHVEHTVACLAYALVEVDGVHPDRDKIASSPIKPGDWIGTVLDQLRRPDADLDSEVELFGGRFSLRALEQLAFSRSPGSRIAYVTDTAWTDTSMPRLTKLAQRADRLYCDSFYSEKQARQADKYRHMTATRAAELAKRARVKDLVLMHFARRYAGRYDELLSEAQIVFPKARAEFDVVHPDLAAC